MWDIDWGSLMIQRKHQDLRKERMESKYRTYRENKKLYNIEKITRNILKKYKIYASGINIYEYPELYIMKFTIYIGYKKQYKIIKILIKYIRSLLILRYNKNIQMNIKFSDVIYRESEILEELLKRTISKNPRKVVRILKKIRNRDINKRIRKKLP